MMLDFGMNFTAPNPICHGAVVVMGFGAVEIFDKYPAQWRASIHPTRFAHATDSFCLRT